MPEPSAALWLLVVDPQNDDADTWVARGTEAEMRTYLAAPANERQYWVPAGTRYLAEVKETQHV